MNTPESSKRMNMKHIDIRFTFEVDQEFLEEEDYETYELKSIRALETNIPLDKRQEIVETLAQSRSFWTEDTWKILDEFERKSQ